MTQHQALCFALFTVSGSMLLAALKTSQSFLGWSDHYFSRSLGFHLRSKHGWKWTDGLVVNMCYLHVKCSFRLEMVGKGGSHDKPRTNNDVPTSIFSDTTGWLLQNRVFKDNWLFSSNLEIIAEDDSKYNRLWTSKSMNQQCSSIVKQYTCQWNPHPYTPSPLHTTCTPQTNKE